MTTTQTDFDRLQVIIKGNLKKKICKRSKNKGCIDDCKDCLKMSLYNKICQKMSEDGRLFTTLEELESKQKNYAEPLFSIAVTVEEQIEALRDYYSKIDFGDHWEDYADDNPMNEQGELGKTLLHNAVENNNREEVERLLNEGVDPFVKDNSGYTAYTIALFEGYTDIVDFLKKRGIAE